MSQARIIKRLFCRSKFESQRKTQDVKTYGKYQTLQKIQEVKNRGSNFVSIIKLFFF